MKEINYNSLWKFSLKVLLGFLSVSVTSIEPGFAQSNIVPDNTLGIESSQINNNNVNRNGIPSTLIEGGAERGQNLFHSLQEFNVGEGRGAYFVVPNDNIQNVLTRVTGNNPSEILGILGTISNRNFDPSNANLFLINPNGIVFGENASLDINGSFVGTTANGIEFGEQGFFSATNPETTPLLTVNPSAFLFSQIKQTASIQNNSVAPAQQSPSGSDAFGLRVPDGKSLLLLGGNVNMNGGELNAYGGRVELGGLAETGTVALDINGNNFSLGFPDNVTRADVSLTNQAKVYVEGAGGGDIVVNARNVEITGGSFLSGGIGQGLGTPETVAGDITLDATGEITVADSSIFNDVRRDSRGNGGNITVNAGSFNLAEGAALTAATFGEGKAGNVTITANDTVSLTAALILSTVETGGVGEGGNIEINAANLTLRDGAQLLTITRGASDTQSAGRGNAGNVNVNVRGVVDIAGEKNGLRSGIISDVGTGTIGNGGNITVNAGSFNLAEGAQLAASTLGEGNAGSVTVTANDTVSLTDASIFSNVEAGGVGDGGNIEINAASLTLRDSAQLITITSSASDTQSAGRGDAGNVNVNVTGVVDIAGVKDGLSSAIFSNVETGTIGNGGNITVNAGSFNLAEGARLSASTFGEGDAGNVTVTAKDTVSFTDANIFSTVQAGGVGDGGNIEINAANLTLRDSAQLQTSISRASDTQSAAQGDAGNVNVNVTGVVDIAGVKDGFSSAIFSDVETGTIGNGGNITVNASSFKLAEGASLDARTFGEGNAGNVTVTANDTVSLTDAAGIFSTVEAGGVGDGGNIEINAPNLTLRDSAQLVTSTREASDTQSAGKGNAGNVNVNVTGVVDIAGVKDGFPSAIASDVETGTSGNGGNITVNAGSFKLSEGALLDARTENNNRGGDITVNTNLFEALNGGQIITTTSNSGNAGKITVNATEKVIINDSDSNFNDRVANFPTRIGNIGANSGFFVRSTGSGNTGNIEINSPKITLDNQARLNAESESVNGGNINLNVSELLLLRRGSQITTNAGTAQQGGNGGNITINAPNGFIVGFPKENSDITANAFTGTGGNVEINSQGIFGIEPRTEQTAQSDITASSQLGVSGNVNLTTPDNSDIQNSLIELLENPIDSEALIASSCVVRSRERNGTFFITGVQGFPYRPGDAVPSVYSTIGVQSVPNSISEKPRRRWKIGDPIVEPSGVYRLENGQRILSRECMK
ncbi:MAG: filamentous hemagglutinin N-terminal domain-containing protein [Rivularia sp. T60_A2020_040]|nr:filamentous hemagglutinin N-terminal domain-containing protein [Rivularia sp. T60_A2020_040]